ncbi:carbohydrate sulfotransferase 14-like [Patiria miniata]|uniref:Carbohydrate sulfotransferase n=1 Tax=Patiria miniata TaxID=46514 RepID=A0A913ZLP7_PATMI|nr:carbohydrate sulfotransferase 14-like [Patiria miniata]XP_038052697.1 carbohydrate sulfotransferase 14-like [Patiria miniata]
MRLGIKRDLKRLVFLLILGAAASVSFIALSPAVKRRHDEPDLDDNDVIRKERHQSLNDPQSDHALVLTGIASQQKFSAKNESEVELNVSSSVDRDHAVQKPRTPVGPKSRAIPHRPPQPREQKQWDYLQARPDVAKPRVYSRNETAAVQTQRQAHMAQVCRDVFKIPPLDLGSPWEPKTYKRILGNTYVNDDFNLTVTIIRKVGSSNWRRFMTSLFDISSKGFKGRWTALKPLGQRTADGIRRELQRNTKVLFVRNPLVRLLSGFRDKFVKLPTAFNIQTANTIIRKIRGRKAKNPAIPDPTFTEFLRYLLGKNGLIGDEHFAPIFKLSKPCMVRYDFIGKLETLPSDTDYLIDKLGVKGRVEYGYPKPYSGSSNTTRLVEYFSRVSPELIQKVCEVYKDDFVAFSYPMPSDFSDLKTYMEKIT